VTNEQVKIPPNEELAADLRRVGLSPSDAAIGKFRDLALLLRKRAGIMNLVGPGEWKRLWERHMLESACYSLLMEKNFSAVDVGSGNGFPGLVLAILGFDMILMEPCRKKYLFLRHAAEKLELTCKVIRCRLEDFEPEEDAYQFTARAVAPAARLLGIIGQKCPKESTLLVREPGIPEEEKYSTILRLPVPPLDRKGFLVQYRVCRSRV